MLRVRSIAPRATGLARSSPSAGRGLTLLELMLVVAVAGILLMLGLPNFSQWLQNSQVRTAADSIANGLQLARAEAVRRNVRVRFQLTSTAAAGLSDWSVSASADGGTTYTVAIQSRNSAEGSPNARVGSSTAAQAATQANFDAAIAAGTGLPTGVVFNALGRAEAGGITRVDVSSSILSAADTRRLVLLIVSGGQIRMCDPKLVLATNAQGCA